MDNATRLLYLEAMGITVWRPKSPGASAPTADGPTASEPLVPIHENNSPDTRSHALRGNAVNTAPAVRGDEFSRGAEVPHLTSSSQETPSDSEDDSPNLFSPAIRSETASPSAVDQLGWDELQATVAACTLCDLCKTRTQTVFGSGNRNAEWMLIGEAPGQQEDLQGAPFVGPAGQLLTEMLRAIGLDRDEVYIANILKCRPPGNRDPRPEEAENCRPYLERQIALIRPKIILAVGRIAAQTLLRTDAPVSKLRGKVHTLNQTPLVVVYHPSYLLRSMLEKKKAWLDLQLALNTYQNNKNKG
ncbi:uracil-DNA glycosylase family protein [Methylomicrobium lacus]|uniref:uracil-DNA glycosylase n=1 Tax=Methylomicrobium lacus TaxID=136992 RepID=UPI0035A999AA